MNKKKDNLLYDVVIIGGGVSGTALAYTLSNYTNVSSIALFEKEPVLAAINSHRNNNSQTLHFGDIETNYSLEKATKVKRSADMIKHFLLKYDKKKVAYTKYHKMVLAVGKEQIMTLNERYREFRRLFPDNKLLGEQEIRKLEPKVMAGRTQEVAAYYSSEGYTIDYQALSQLFISLSKNVNVHLNKKVVSLQRVGELFEIITDEGKKVMARTVAVTSGAHSLLLAKRMGYGKNLALFSIAGSFYFVPECLNGKVYTIQRKKLPFAAIHGDPDVHEKGKTRFGPTAKAVLLLERHRYRTFFEYLKTTGLHWRTLISFININSDPVILGYIIKNFLYDLPFIGKRLFLKEIQKIIPNITLKEVHKAKGYGGIRPQVVNNSSFSLDMGEAKIVERGILFNITPSPGASTSLANAEKDTETIIKHLGKKYSFNKKGFEQVLVCGPACWNEQKILQKQKKKGPISEETVLSFG